MAGGLASRLEGLLGEGKVYADPLIVSLYAREASGLESDSLPDAVVFPESVDDVSRLASFAYKRDLKLYPQGSSSAVSGAALPSSGVVVSFERMNRILEVNVVDGVAVVQPGVRLEDLDIELARLGYMFPVDPASVASATVGGAINTGAGGMRGAKYGTMRDWVLGLQIVLPDEDGTVMRIGCRTVKCRQGYDLVRLIVGSEGTLALVTEATLRIAPLPEVVVTVLAFFKSLEDLVGAVVEIKRSRVQPLIMEFMDDKTVKVAAEHVKVPIKAEGHMLLVSVDVNREAAGRVLEWLAKTMRRQGAGIVYTAKSMEEAEEKGLYAIRRSLYPAQVMMARRLMKGAKRLLVLLEDIAVPPSRLAEAVEGLRDLEERLGLTALLGGHIGDGNLHPAVGFDPEDDSMKARVYEWYFEVMKLAVKLGGTVSAEHGIGLAKKEGLRMELESLGALKALDIMRAIKRAFDPKGILNPGKVI